MLSTAKRFVPVLIRLCVISTFIEDGIRIAFYDWDWHTKYFAYEYWECGMFLASMMFGFIILVELAGSLMILFRWKVDFACAILIGVIRLQVIYRYTMA